MSLPTTSPGMSRTLTDPADTPASARSSAPSHHPGTVVVVTAAATAPPTTPGPRRKTPPTAAELLAAAVGAVPGGAPRPGQQAMVAAIESAIGQRHHLLVQAGTGTGKSLAYLAPALLVDGPVVVSTATLALQNQLVEHDLPRLADAVEPVLGRRPTFAVLKGRHHYLCLAKMRSEERRV